SVWTKKVERGKKIAERLRAGVVTINNHAFTGALPQAPWSGYGETGYGITNSALALRAGRQEPREGGALVVPVHPRAPNDRRVLREATKRHDADPRKNPRRVLAGRRIRRAHAGWVIRPVSADRWSGHR